MFTTMRQLYLILLLSIFNTHLLHAQVNPGPDIAWQQCYGGTGTDHYYNAIKTSDGGYIARIVSGSTDGDLTDVETPGGWIIKYDSTLNVQWQNFYADNPCNVQAAQILEFSSHYYLLGYGGSECPEVNGNNDIVITKITLDGEVVWTRLFGSPGFEEYGTAIVTQDSCLLFAGESFSSGGDVPIHYGSGFYQDIIIGKVDTSGNLLWLEVLGGSIGEAALSNIHETARGEYLFTFGSTSNDHDLAVAGFEGRKLWFCKMDSLGNVMQQAFYDGDYYANNASVFVESVVLGDHLMLPGFLKDGATFPGFESYGQFDGCLALINYEDLTFEALYQYGGSKLDVLTRLKSGPDGRFYLLGYSYSSDIDLPDNYNDGAEEDYWLLALNPDYSVAWSRNFGGSQFFGDLGGSSLKGSIIADENNVIAFLSVEEVSVLPDYDITCSKGGGDDAWLVVFDLTTGIVEPHQQPTIQVYPNPADSFLHINSNQLPNTEYNIQIIDILGRVVWEGLLHNAAQQHIDISPLQSGTYQIILFDVNGHNHSIPFIVNR
ncbi:MAG: T9SS type A sorting domain-containing protein [Chitinophagales bacterium]|nr:T9SS type A sorting domain-containing protein [Chitinophagales bacterium]